MGINGTSCRRLWETAKCYLIRTHAVLKALWRRLGPSWRRLGGVLEAAWKRVLAFWRRLEESLALLGGGLKPLLDWRTILMRLGGGLEASCARLEALLEASWRRLGGVLQLP